MTFSEFTQLLEVVIWPITVLIILFMFKPYVSKSFERLGSLKASPTGFELTFEKALETAKETFEKNKPEQWATSKSAGNLAFAKAYDTPYDQLTAIKKSLDTTIESLAAEKEISTTGKTSEQLLKELTAINAIRPENVTPLKSLLIAVNTAPMGLSKNQVNTLQSLHDAL